MILLLFFDRSGPAATFGTDGMDKYRGTFHIHRLTLAAGGVRVTASERVGVTYDAAPDAHSANPSGEDRMLRAGTFTFGNFLLDVLAIFIFVMWFWLLITVISDLFRRHDTSGLVKAIWVIVLILFPYIGVFVYLITQSRGMAERSSQRAQQAREELRHIVGFSAADEIEKLERLKAAGTISNDEYQRLRAKVVA